MSVERFSIFNFCFVKSFVIYSIDGCVGCIDGLMYKKLEIKVYCCLKKSYIIGSEILFYSICVFRWFFIIWFDSILKIIFLRCFVNNCFVLELFKIIILYGDFFFFMFFYYKYKRFF